MRSVSVVSKAPGCRCFPKHWRSASNWPPLLCWRDSKSQIDGRDSAGAHRLCGWDYNRRADPRQCGAAAYRGSVSGFAWLFDRTKARPVRDSNCAVNPATTARNFLKHTNTAREAKINVTRQHAATHKAIVDAMRTSFEQTIAIRFSPKSRPRLSGGSKTEIL